MNRFSGKLPEEISFRAESVIDDDKRVSHVFEARVPHPDESGRHLAIVLKYRNFRDQPDMAVSLIKLEPGAPIAEIPPDGRPYAGSVQIHWTAFIGNTPEFNEIRSKIEQYPEGLGKRYRDAFSKSSFVRTHFREGGTFGVSGAVQSWPEPLDVRHPESRDFEFLLGELLHKRELRLEGASARQSTAWQDALTDLRKLF